MIDNRDKIKNLVNELKSTIKFSRLEFACKCGCGMAAIDLELILCLEQVRATIEYEKQAVVIMEISSGNRCSKHNKNTPGAADDSYHVKAMAVDLKVAILQSVKGKVQKVWLSPAYVYAIIDSMFIDKYGLLLYTTWVHFDIRTFKYR